MLNNEPFSLIKYIFLVGEMHGTGRDSNGISELPLIQLIVKLRDLITIPIN